MSEFSSQPSLAVPDDAQPGEKPNVLLCNDLTAGSLESLVKRYFVNLVWIDDEEKIPGSYWGDSEAGLNRSDLLVRGDTPVHSALHELCHYVCMEPARRDTLDTNAGGDYDEENAVCFLQILLADHIPELGRRRMLQDMNSWGYTFRLGSAQAWFEQDAEEVQEWLLSQGIINQKRQVTWQLRGAANQDSRVV